MPRSDGKRRALQLLPRPRIRKPPPYNLSAAQRRELRALLPASLMKRERLRFLRSVARAFGCFRADIEHPRPRPAETRARIDELLELTEALRRRLKAAPLHPDLRASLDYVLSQGACPAPADTDAERREREADPRYGREQMELARRSVRLAAAGDLTAQQLCRRMSSALGQLEYALRLARGPRDPGGRPLVDVARAALVKRLAIIHDGLGIPVSTSSKGALGSILRLTLVDIEHKTLSADRVRDIIRRALKLTPDRKKPPSKNR
jgi:hypothetical protein